MFVYRTYNVFNWILYKILKVISPQTLLACLFTGLSGTIRLVDHLNDISKYDISKYGISKYDISKYSNILVETMCKM